MQVQTPTELRTKTTSSISQPSCKAFKEDLLLQPDPDEEVTGTHGTSNLLDLNQLSDSSENDQRSNAAPSTSLTRPDSKPAVNPLENLTQSLLSTNKKNPNIEGEIAGLMDNVLTGELKP